MSQTEEIITDYGNWTWLRGRQDGVKNGYPTPCCFNQISQNWKTEIKFEGKYVC